MKWACRVSAVAGLLIAASCAERLVCDVCWTTAIANVFVHDSAGQPLPNIWVDVHTYLDVCGGALRGAHGRQVIPSGGRARLLISSLSGPHVTHCSVVLVGHDETQLDSVDFQVDLRFRADDPSPRDSVQLEVLLDSDVVPLSSSGDGYRPER